MARLSEAEQVPLTHAFPLETWRRIMRQHRNPEANIETELDAWVHRGVRELKKAIAQGAAPWWPPRNPKANLGTYLADLDHRVGRELTKAIALETPPQWPEM